MRGSALIPNIGDLSRLHRQVTNLAVVGAWVCTAILAVAALISGDGHYLIEASGPAIAAITFTIQRALNRHDAVIVFGTATVTVTVTFYLVGDDTTLMPASVSIVLIAMLATLFVERNGAGYIVLGAVWMVMTSVLWLGPAWASTGLTMVVSFVIGSVILLLVRNSAVETQHRYQQMFELAPIGLMEQDWTKAVRLAAIVPGESRTELTERLRRDPEFVRLLIEAVSVTRVNAEAGSIAGVPPSSLTEAISLSQVLPADTDAWIDQIVAVVHEDEGYYAEHSTRRFTGDDIFVGIRSISIERARDGVRRLVAIDDITEQRLAEEAAAELVRAKDQFIASVSHELRTPLAAIVGFTAEMASGAIAVEERGEISDLIHEQATEMSHIVEDLLVAARADAGSITVKVQPLNTATLVERVISQHSGSPVHAVFDRDLVAMVDPVRTSQILRNLLSNAERYGRPPIEVACYRTDDFVVIDVHDHGDPLSEADRARIFQPYVRAHDDRTGLTAAVGLGLAVSRQLAELMGGTLAYVYADGSTFRLTLPAHTAEATPEPAAGIARSA